jgi:alkylated DNA repair protein (DNA oxidative demethylase)
MMPRKGDAMVTLFDEPAYERSRRVELAPGAVLLPSFAAEQAEALVAQLHKVVTVSPFRRMVTPGGFPMSVEMTNCGTLGWITDKEGYRYKSTDPLTGLNWPAMSTDFLTLAEEAALESDFEHFNPNACLVNRYEPKSKLSLHQDKDEKDFTAPIVSVSLGLSARFLFGGIKRSDPINSILLHHGDVIVWGGPSRLRHHGIAPVHEGSHPLIGSYRINLTFRRAA